MTNESARLRLSLVITISLGACSARDEPAHVAASSTIDSAGIRIIDSRVPAWSSTDAWTIGEKALLSVGTVDGAAEYQLSRVQNVLELSDGRIIVANGGTHQIICYSKDGRFLWASGRGGQGPGEYATLTRIARYSGDSILVHDFGQRRYSLISPSGTYARSWTLAPPDDSTLTSSLHLSGVLGNGSLVIHSLPARRGKSPPAVTRAPTRLLLYSATGEPLGELGTFPGDEYYEGSGFDIRRLPYARSTRFASADNRIFVAADDTYEIRVLDTTGRIQSLVRRQFAAEPITDAAKTSTREALRTERARERAQRFRGMPDTILRRIVADEDKMFDNIPFPPTYPAFGRVLIDDERFVWVENFSTSGSAAEGVWSIFHPEGYWLGDVGLPRGFTLHQPSARHLLGVQTDDMGVEYVRVFPIVGRFR